MQDEVKYVKRIQLRPLEPFSLVRSGFAIKISTFYWEGQSEILDLYRKIESVAKNTLGQDTIHTEYAPRMYPYVKISMLLSLIPLSEEQPNDCNLETLITTLGGQEWEIGIEEFESEQRWVCFGSFGIYIEDIEQGKFYSLKGGKPLDLEKLKQSDSDK